MEIKILGPGCANCATLEKRTKEAVAHLGVDASFTKVTDFADIVGYGIMKTPGLVVDEQVLVSGRVPAVSEIERLLQAAAG